MESCKLYDRKIKYLDYRENGQRIRGVGFLKLEACGERCSFHMQIRGIHGTESFVRKVYLVTSAREAYFCETELKQGRGEVDLQNLRRDDLRGTGVAYEELLAVRMAIGAGKEIYCRIAEQEAEKKAVLTEPAQETRPPQGQTVESVPEVRQEAGAEVPAQMQSEEREQDVVEESPAQMQTVEKEREAVKKEPVCVQTEEKKREAVKDAPVQPAPSQLPLHDNKWKQLTAIYPHMRPFQDEREYLSVTPADFVILGERSYRLVDNSFLLHGYYNYEHLILTRIMRKGELRYYIGVPGSFYDRERQVAIMFGFESFECRQEPAGEGDFGYYMVRVEL